MESKDSEAFLCRRFLVFAGLGGGVYVGFDWTWRVGGGGWCEVTRSSVSIAAFF